MNNKNVEKIFIGFFGILVSFFLLGLVVLSFFNHAAADDYYALSYTQKYGFFGFQHFVYLHWGGRYLSNFITAVFSKNSFLNTHYYLHTLILIFITIVAFFYLVWVLNKYLINNAINLRDRIIFSFLISINIYVTYPELSTALYWFSSAITYQTSVILLILLLAVLINLMQVNNTKTKAFLITGLIFLIIAINGSNEVSALTSAVIMMIVFITNKRRISSNTLVLVLATIFYVFSILILILAPGNKERMSISDGKNINILFSFCSVVYRIFFIYWHIFQSPLFWVSTGTIGLYAIHIRDKIFMLKHHKANLKTILLFITLWSLLLIIILLPILLLSNGSIPDRALNVLSAASLLAFMMIAFYIGICVTNKNVKNVLNNTQLYYSVATILLISLVANHKTKELAASLISAKTYNAAMTSREDLLKNASLLKLDSISLPPIEEAMQLSFQHNNTSNTKATLKEWMLTKPSLLFISDDIETSGSRKILQEYYGLKIGKGNFH